MTIQKSIQMAFKQLRSSKLRSFLTMLGIIIGVFSIVLLISLGNGMAKNVASELSDLGSNVISVSFVPQNVEQTLDYETGMALAPVDTIAAPEETRTEPIVAHGERANEQVVGTNQNYAAIKNLVLSKGRFLAPSDLTYHEQVAVIGAGLAEELFPNQSAVGQSILINGAQFEVIGVLKKQKTSLTGSADEKLLIPMTSASRLFQSNEVSLFYYQATGGLAVDQAEKELKQSFSETFPQNETKKAPYTILNQQATLDAVNSITSTLTLGLGAIAIISLMVGGIGIMNIMLVSVTERTREIGIRKAIGATGGNILSQFLIEAIVLSLFGGFIGLLSSGLVIQLLSNVLSFAIQLDFQTALIALGFSVLTGVLFGVVPAYQASKKLPIEALRFE
ncbi:ABC transporter permease [Listeria costaricensis]|uniref:ABC transporter permease n=1 Tax=Listeria costaricensis TaxID=2026604 RepID=UPI000C08C730|nr:ABC transporter permease [Listeria costaricensis]